jgi:hypothetical protein
MVQQSLVFRLFVLNQKKPCIMIFIKFIVISKGKDMFDLGLIIAIWTVIQDSGSMISFSLGWLNNQWLIVRTDRKYRMKMLGYLTALGYATLCFFVIAALLLLYGGIWVANPFAVPVNTTLLVSIAVMFTPLIIGMPIVAYLERFPPQTWNM